MSILAIFNRPGSHAARVIREETGIRHYIGSNKIKVDAIINYGLSGPALRAKMSSARGIPTLNSHIETSKLRALRVAEKNGIVIPESKTQLTSKDDLKDWIEKRYASQGGRGIRMASRRGEIPGKYFQKFIRNRPYEIRVHAFKWLPKEQWTVQRRIGNPTEVAWNFEQGGFFMGVYRPEGYRTYREALSVSQKILDIMGMQFGAVDFVLDERFKLYFIEINSAPGFTELSQSVYINAFNKLKGLSAQELARLTK